jgi:hypothetical protein
MECGGVVLVKGTQQVISKDCARRADATKPLSLLQVFIVDEFHPQDYAGHGLCHEPHSPLADASAEARDTASLRLFDRLHHGS